MEGLSLVHTSDLLGNFHFLNVNGSFQKTSIPPPRRKLKVNPPAPFGCPDTCIYYYQKQFFLPSPSGRQKFPLWGECGSFLERPNVTHCQKYGTLFGSIHFITFWKYTFLNIFHATHSVTFVSMKKITNKITSVKQALKCNLNS
jgi:hypothetical protein